MPDASTITAIIDEYLAAVSAGDPDRVVALYADDAVVEDPIGSPAHNGATAIREFYAGTTKLADRLECTRTTPVNAAANQAAFGFTIHSHVGDAVFEIFSIDVMTFGEDGLITSMRAFWNPADIKQAS